MSATGPSIRAVCRIINKNSCGSGSVCGHYEGGSLVLSNAHVAGNQVGRIVVVEHEQSGKRFNGKVIRAAYSDRVIADWALIHIPGWQAVQPVKLSKLPPESGLSMYTKGFPRCKPHNGTDIRQHRTLSNGVQLWLPDAIGGQSGSGVWSDKTNLQMCLLTWSWTDGGRSYGAGQLTSEIWKQNRAGELRGYPMMPGLTELPGDYDLDADERGYDDPVVEEGFNSIPMPRGIQDFPIWAEDDDHGGDDPPPPDTDWKARGIAALRRIRDAADSEITAFEKSISQPLDPDKPGLIHDTFGL